MSEYNPNQDPYESDPNVREVQRGIQYLSLEDETNMDQPMQDIGHHMQQQPMELELGTIYETMDLDNQPLTGYLPPQQQPLPYPYNQPAFQTTPGFETGFPTHQPTVQPIQTYTPDINEFWGSMTSQSQPPVSPTHLVSPLSSGRMSPTGHQQSPTDPNQMGGTAFDHSLQRSPSPTPGAMGGHRSPPQRDLSKYDNMFPWQIAPSLFTQQQFPVPTSSPPASTIEPDGQEVVDSPQRQERQSTTPVSPQPSPPPSPSVDTSDYYDATGRLINPNEIDLEDWEQKFLASLPPDLTLDESFLDYKPPSDRTRTPSPQPSSTLSTEPSVQPKRRLSGEDAIDSHRTLAPGVRAPPHQLLPAPAQPSLDLIEQQLPSSDSSGGTTDKKRGRDEESDDESEGAVGGAHTSRHIQQARRRKQ